MRSKRPLKSWDRATPRSRSSSPRTWSTCRFYKGSKRTGSSADAAAHREHTRPVADSLLLGGSAFRAKVFGRRQVAPLDIVARRILRALRVKVPTLRRVRTNCLAVADPDRKSTRLNSSHGYI